MKKKKYIHEKIVVGLWCIGLLLIVIDIILYYCNQSQGLYFIRLFGTEIWNDQICSSPQLYIWGILILMLGSLLFPYVFGKRKAIWKKIGLMLATIVIQGTLSLVVIIIVSTNMSLDILPRVDEMSQCQIVHKDVKLYVSHDGGDLLLFVSKGKLRVKWLDSHSNIESYRSYWDGENFVIEMEKGQGKEVACYSYKQLKGQ